MCCGRAAKYTSAHPGGIGQSAVEQSTYLLITQLTVLPASLKTRRLRIVDSTEAFAVD